VARPSKKFKTELQICGPSATKHRIGVMPLLEIGPVLQRAFPSRRFRHPACAALLSVFFPRFASSSASCNVPSSHRATGRYSRETSPGPTAWPHSQENSALVDKYKLFGRRRRQRARIPATQKRVILTLSLINTEFVTACHQAGRAIPVKPVAPCKGNRMQFLARRRPLHVMEESIGFR